MGQGKKEGAAYVKEMDAYHEKHPEHEDVYYAERFCLCGSVRKFRAHKEQLWNAAETGLLDEWEKAHSRPPHKQVTEAEAIKQRALVGAFRKGG